MSRKVHTPEQIIRKLREAEIFMAQGMTAQQAARQIGVTEQTYYRWRKEYGGKVIQTDNCKVSRLCLAAGAWLWYDRGVNL